MPTKGIEEKRKMGERDWERGGRERGREGEGRQEALQLPKNGKRLWVLNNDTTAVQDCRHTGPVSDGKVVP